MKLVFDTYAWVEYFSGSKEGKIVEEYLQNSEIITPSIALLELSHKADKEGWDMNTYLNFIKMNSTIVGINDSFILSFGNVHNQSKKKVKDIGIADCIILATARLYEAKVLTGDPHFSSFQESILLR